MFNASRICDGQPPPTNADCAFSLNLPLLVKSLPAEVSTDISSAWQPASQKASFRFQNLSSPSFSTVITRSPAGGRKAGGDAVAVGRAVGGSVGAGVFVAISGTGVEVGKGSC